MANEPIREVVVNGNTYRLLADSAEVRDLLTAEDNTVFQFVKSGNKYGYKDANGNFIPFDKVQAGKTVTAGTSVKTVTPDGDYDGLASVTINPTPSQAKSITAATSAQTVNPDSGKLLSKVTVNPQPHTATRAAVTSNGTVDLGETHNIRYVPVSVNTSPVEKIIRGTFGFNSDNSSATVSVSCVASRCQVTIYGNGAWYGDTDNLGVYVSSLSNTALVLGKMGGGNNRTSTFSYEIIQYKSNVVKQIVRKTFNIGNASSGTVSLGATINPNKCHVTIHGVGGGDGYNVNNAGLYVSSINSNSIVVADSAGFKHNYTHSLEVVEFY